MGFFKFDQLITPKILAATYLLLVIFCIVMAIKTGSTNAIQMLGWVFAAIVARIPFELAMVTFKNNEYLRRICETAEAKKSE